MLSVIVPVYNVEKYLDRCVQSLVNQTLKDMEIILVDDGSTDTSGSLCDDYARQYENIVVVHKENGGLTSAWMAGVKASKGDYLGFVDSDDWVDEDMYQTMYEKALEKQVDMVCCGLVKEFEEKARKNTYLSDRLEKDYYEKEDIIQKIRPVFFCDGSFDSRAIPASRCMKLYRRVIVEENMKYCNEQVSIGEDLVITFAAFLDCQSIYTFHDYYPYHYWINESSLTGKHDRNYMDKLITLREQLLYINEKKNSGYDYRQQIMSDFLFLTLMCIKEEVYKNREESFGKVTKNVAEICQSPQVQEALAAYHMPKMMLSGKIFVFMMKHKLYTPMVLGLRLVFS